MAPGLVVPFEAGVEEADVVAPPPVLPVHEPLVRSCSNTIPPNLPQSGSYLPVLPTYRADIVVDLLLDVSSWFPAALARSLALSLSLSLFFFLSLSLSIFFPALGVEN